MYTYFIETNYTYIILLYSLYLLSSQKAGAYVYNVYVLGAQIFPESFNNF